MSAMTPQLLQLLAYALRLGEEGHGIVSAMVQCRGNFLATDDFQNEIRLAHNAGWHGDTLYRTSLHDTTIMKMLVAHHIEHTHVSPGVMTVDRTSMCQAIGYSEGDCYAFVLELIREVVNDDTCYVAWSGRSDDHLMVEVQRRVSVLRQAATQAERAS
jgi:hypothetical protein